MVNPNHISPTLYEKLVRSGADSVFIDCEHGLASWEDIHHMAKAARYAGGFGIVRPQNQERSTLTRCLNAGADGVMVPLIHTAEIARDVVRRFRYAVPDDHANRLLIGMVESAEAVKNVDEILAVEGIDVFFVGPGDLSQSMGYSPNVPPGGRRAQPALDLVDETLRRIRAAGKCAGTLVVKQDTTHLVAQGAQLLYYHADPFVADGVQVMRGLAGMGVRGCLRGLQWWLSSHCRWSANRSSGAWQLSQSNWISNSSAHTLGARVTAVFGITAK